MGVEISTLSLEEGHGKEEEGEIRWARPAGTDAVQSRVDADDLGFEGKEDESGDSWESRCSPSIIVRESEELSSSGTWVPSASRALDSSQRDEIM